MLCAIRSARPLALVVALSLGMVYAPVTGALPAGNTRLDVRVLSQGQPLRGADVRVVNLETAQVLKATTDQAGNVVLDLDAGVYQVTARVDGYLSGVSRLVTTRANAPATITVSMAVAQQEYENGGKVVSGSGSTLTLENGDTITIDSNTTFSSKGLYFSVGEVISVLATTGAEVCVAYTGDPVTTMVAGGCGANGAVLGAGAGVAVAAIAIGGGAGAAAGLGALAIAGIVAGAVVAGVVIAGVVSDDTP